MVAQTERDRAVELLVDNAGSRVAGARVGGPDRGLVARPRGERARRLSLLPGRDPRDDRARREGGSSTSPAAPRTCRARRRPRTARARRRCTASASCSRRARAHGIPVFSISPGLVRTAMTEDVFPDDAPWTPPEAAPRLVRKLATGATTRSPGATSTRSTTTLDELLARRAGAGRGPERDPPASLRRRARIRVRGSATACTRRPLRGRCRRSAR